MNKITYQFFLSKRNHFLKILKQDYPKLYKHIQSLNGRHDAENLYIYFFQQDKCHCGKPAKFEGFTSGYLKNCSKKCSYTNPARMEKIKQTNLKKYGVDNPFKSKEILSKIKEAKREKYGNVNYNNPKKFKETCLKKYGVPHPRQNCDVIEKTKQTCQKKYGGNSPSNSSIVIEKIKQTNLKKYKKACFFETRDFKRKSQKTCLSKYGVKNPQNVIIIKEKTKQTCIERYGVDNPSKCDTIKKKQFIKFYNDFLKENHLVKPLFNENEYFGFKHNGYEFQCHKCQHKFIFDRNWRQILSLKCPKCYPLGRSAAEMDINDFIKSLIIKFKSNDRTLIKPLELDVYLPDYKIAIEYNGVYWHSELKGKDKNYHLNKTKLCKEQNIQLLHIFDNEWNDKQDIVKSIIKSKLQLNDRIFARKTIIKEVITKDKSSFLNKNHIQGADRSNVNIGLYYNDELVSMMTFCKSRYNKKYQWEISRFCNKLNMSVIGGASKLLKYFERNYNPESIITYADKRYSNGNLYKQLGFEYLHDSNPNYFYFNLSSKLYSRNLFQKHKLKDKLNIFNEELTEWQNMVNNGYDRIWDCGNLVFGKNLLRF